VVDSKYAIKLAPSKKTDPQQSSSGSSKNAGN
jgi:hypothetical protein